jgi:hypothetical protein
MGLLNVFWWGSGAIGQLMCGWIIKSYGISDDGRYSEKGYRIGIWWLSIALTTLSLIPASFMKYTLPAEDPIGEELTDESKSTSQVDEL